MKKFEKECTTIWLEELSPINIKLLNELWMKKSKQLDKKGNASYYNTQRISGMDALERMFGTYETMIFCEMTAMKYRLRMGKKEDQPVKQELLKIEWYEERAKYYEAKLKKDVIPSI